MVIKFNRYLKLWLAFAKISLARQLEYKANFVSTFIIEICWTFVTVFTLEIIFTQTSSISGWNQGEIYLIYGLFRITKSIKDIFFRLNMSRFSQLINTGEFDILLTKPVNILFYSFTRLVAFDRTSQLWIGLIMLSYAFYQLPIKLNLSSLILLILVISIGTWIRVAVGIYIHTPVFWFQKLENIFNLELTIYSPARFPRTVFPFLLQQILTFVIPILLVAAIPAEILLGKTNLYILFPIIIFTLFLCWGSYKFFFFALKHYSSASS